MYGIETSYGNVVIFYSHKDFKISRPVTKNTNKP